MRQRPGVLDDLAQVAGIEVPQARQ